MKYLTFLLIVVALLVVGLISRPISAEYVPEPILISPEQAIYEPMTQEDLTPIVVDRTSENYKRAMRWAEHKEGDPRPADWDTNMTIVEFE
jgi:hypothetical protein